MNYDIWAEIQKEALPSLNSLIIPWLGRQSLFQTFDDDPDVNRQEIEELLADQPEVTE